jgi:sugar O-acyltransferase (sialic acid O-acetyltransferase NeuD family)
VTPGPLTVFAVATPYSWDVVESAMRRGYDVRCVDNLGGADARLPGLVCLADVDGDQRSVRFTLGLASAEHRGPAAAAARDAGFDQPVALVDPTAVVPSTAEIAHGAYVNAGAVLGSYAEIGCHAHVNRAATVGHDARLAFGASLGPGVVLTGHVEVGAGAFVGAGATVLPGVRLGAHSVVGAGSVVTRDVAVGAVVVGSPARVLRTRDLTGHEEEPKCPHC